jgi:hypothetical protein
MNKIAFLLIPILCWSLPVSAGNFTSTAAQSALIPSLSIEAPSYEFAPAIEGDIVTHEFIIKNSGSVPLEIIKLESDCGCTTATSERLILPGDEGFVKASFSTKGYGGMRVRKVIKLHTNDPVYKTVTVSMSGEVRELARIEPRMASLKGKSDTDVTTLVKIFPVAVPDFNITDTTAKDGKHIDFKLEKQKDGGKPVFLLTVRNKKESSGRFFDIVIMTTDTTPKREIRVRVFGDIQP